MSISAIPSLPPQAVQSLQQAQNVQKPVAQPVQSAATDSDGDNDGSGGSISITPPVNIKA